MGALVWDVRGFGDNGWSGTRFQGFRNRYRGLNGLANLPLLLLPPPLGPPPPLPHPISSSTPTACAAATSFSRLVEFFEMNGRVHTSTAVRRF